MNYLWVNDQRYLYQLFCITKFMEIEGYQGVRGNSEIQLLPGAKFTQEDVDMYYVWEQNFLESIQEYD